MNLSFFEELRRRNVLRVGAAYVVTAWLLIQVAETIFPLFGLGDTPARIVVTLLAIGLVPVLIFAWAFELTPEGLKREHEVDRSRSITVQTGRRLDRTIMVVLALALGYFAFDKFVLDPARDAEEVASARQEGRTEALIENFGDKSIAVLAFQDMSPNKDQEYLSDGIAEELLNLLTRIPHLRVISRSSAFSFKGRDVPIPDIAQQLNVAHVLEGSVRKSGNRIRITAQLIDARSDTHLWSQTYDRDLGDIFAIQDEIADAMAEQLRLQLVGTIPQVREINPEAYDLYLRALQARWQMNNESNLEALALLQQALALEPDHADSWALLGKLYLGAGMFRPMPLETGGPLALEAARKALELDSLNGKALGVVLGVHVARHELAEGATALEDAVAAGSEDSLLTIMGSELLLAISDLNTQSALLQHAIARDPLEAVYYSQLGVVQALERKLQESKASHEMALSLNPNRALFRGRYSGTLMLLGELEAALVEAEREPHPGFRLFFESVIHRQMGHERQSEELLQELIEWRGPGRADLVFWAYAWFGDYEKALSWLDQHRDELEINVMAYINNDPRLDVLRDDSRYQGALRPLGIAPEQVASIKVDLDFPE